MTARSRPARRPPTAKAELLQRFGLVAREDLAAMLGVSVKTLMNRPRDRLPAGQIRIGGKLFFREEAVRDFLAAHEVPAPAPAATSARIRPAA